MRTHRFRRGDLIAYRLKDWFGYQIYIGEVTHYLKNGWVGLTLTSGTWVAIPEHIPVKLNTVWKDTLKPVQEQSHAEHRSS